MFGSQAALIYCLEAGKVLTCVFCDVVIKALYTFVAAMKTAGKNWMTMGKAELLSPSLHSVNLYCAGTRAGSKWTLFCGIQSVQSTREAVAAVM